MSKILKLNSYSRYDELGDRDYMVYEVDYNDGHEEYVSRDVFRRLKALEFIKEKGLSTNELWFIKSDKSWEIYVETMKELYWGDDNLEKVLKSKEEYDLLKEVLTTWK